MFSFLTDTHTTHTLHKIELLLALGNSFHGDEKQRGLAAFHTGLFRSRVQHLTAEKNCAHRNTHIMFQTTCEDSHRHYHTNSN